MGLRLVALTRYDGTLRISRPVAYQPNGSGVGLALAQQIARAHGGEIRLMNREDGEGARATIRLPLP